MTVGRSTTYRIWVEGTRERVELRVHNAAPDVVRLKGGDDQFLHTSGGRNNEAKVKLKSLRPGSAKIDVHPYSRDAKQEASSIAVEIAPRLAALQTTFARERAALRGPPYPAKAWTALLDRTEAALLEILSYPELAAMRDSVTAEFRQARAELRRPRQADLSFSRPRQGIALAAFQSPSPPAHESGLDRIVRLLARLTSVSQERDLIVSLCIVSQPQVGATVRLHPQSFPDGKRETRTTGKLSLFRGLYVYQAEFGGKRIRCVPDSKRDPLESCAPLDLLYNWQPVLACDFGPGNCALRSGSAEAVCQ